MSYQVVAAIDGKLVSIFDGETEYRLGCKVLARRGTPGKVPMDCCFFSWATEREAKVAVFPASSKLLHAPRVLIALRATACTYVDKKNPHKLAHEEVYVERIVAFRTANVWHTC
ncbi:hypothetical protein KFL_004490040 [Klebsormidium nitens]|uniref:Uncharacterized protein n=1 Tax=Klebsormidium nitens TaxID=105231 RepID=A0A1Y1IJ16_KLENI|nr:hypothetical protein KFL_004490040 [Klebsormidium nitens]|eukprot:GAQ88657.1 hypothetical protein KFL_004490040 [Klebsormidium nitens]